MPALGDRLKYYRNYDSSKAKWVNVEDAPEDCEVRTKKTFKQKCVPNSPVVPLPLPGEDQASFARHVKFLLAEEKKLQPNKQVWVIFVSNSIFSRLALTIHIDAQVPCF